jgi:putative FmdB family regulatory protein
MPIYEYWCPQCRASFEKLRSMESKDSEVTCSRCGSHVKRMVSVFAAVSVGRSAESESYQAGRGGCACGGNCSCRN